MRDPGARSSKLSRLLGEIARRRALGELTGEGRACADPGTTVAATPVAIDEILPGGVLEDGDGAVFVHERLRSTIERPRTGWGRLARGRRGAPGRTPAPEWMWDDAAEPGSEPGEEPSLEADLDTLAPSVLHAELESLLRCDLRRVVFLDLETGGLGGACVFLAGTMRWSGEDFVLRQYFARHYGEEPALLRGVGAYLADAEALVTFNGKSFDVPLLRERGVRHRLDLRLPALHVDLLHHARAAWRGRVPNCRLVTLEAYVCRRRRSGDIPGDEIPGLYHDYVREGQVHRLIPVFHHNLLDVITMDELLRRLL